MDKQKFENMISQLSNEEKALITCELWGNPSNPLESYGITKLRCGDSAKPVDFFPIPEEKRKEGEYYCNTYPSSAALGAGWNREYCHKVGENIGRSSKLHGVDIVCRPGMNIKRSPLCGRNFEYFSEDPVVTGELAASFIQGVQSQGTSACPKHFLCNNQEFERMTTNAVVSERALREIYIRGFQIAIEKAAPWSIMTSYNKVNGQYVNVSSHLMNILRKELHYDGYVMSDGGAVQTGTAVASHANGMDGEMGYFHPVEVQDALDSGELSQEVINDNLRHIVETYEKIHSVEATGEVNQEEEHKLARAVAADCAVLLQNDGILPLEKNTKVAVIGKLAKQPNFMGGGSGFSNAWKLDITYDKIAEKLGELPAYADAYTLGTPGDEEELLQEILEAAQSAEVILYFTGIPYGWEVEGQDRKNLQLPADQLRVLQKLLSLGKMLVVVNVSGSAVDMTELKCANAILHSYPAGEGMGGALADILFGDAEPGGRLAETFPVRIEDTPAYLNYISYPYVRNNVIYGEDIFVGYRWYDTRKIEPAFPFGYGLSYTRFLYGEPQLDKSSMNDADKLTVKIPVKNIGQREGTQVLQIYVSQEQSMAIRPEKELKGFEKVQLQPGEEKTVTIMLDRQAFEYFSEEQNKWIAESGKYLLHIAISSREIIATKEIELQSGDRGYLYHYDSPYERFSRNPKLKEACDFLEGEQRRFFEPDSQKDFILDSPFAYATQIYHAVEDNSMLINELRLKNSELSRVISNLNRS